MSTITLPPQSWEISSTNGCPNPGEPRGFGSTTTQPCAAQSAGFHRDDHASAAGLCGPPWMMKTVLYFCDGLKFGGLSSQYWIGVPPAPGTVRLSGGGIETSRSHAAFSVVSALTLPSAELRNRSAGAVNADFENTANPLAAVIAEIAPPVTTRLGDPPANGTVKRFPRACSGAVNQIVVPSGEMLNSSTDRSGVVNTVRFELVCRS